MPTTNFEKHTKIFRFSQFVYCGSIQERHKEKKKNNLLNTRDKQMLRTCYIALAVKRFKKEIDFTLKIQFTVI